MKHGEFPTQDNCDPKKPDEFMAWAMVAPPRMKGAALILPSEYCQLYSGDMWKKGFRWHKRYQEIEWHPPASGDAHWLTSPGKWVPLGTPRSEQDRKVNMVTVLEAMKKADEGDFLAALDHVNKAGKKK